MHDVEKTHMEKPVNTLLVHVMMLVPVMSSTQLNFRVHFQFAAAC